MFKSVYISKAAEKQHVEVKQLESTDLPESEVLVEIAWSSLNYKDALAITGKGPVVRQFPMIPGIDFAGIVKESSSSEYKQGDRVLLNGWGVGEKHWGGLSELARVKASWLTRVPDAISLKRAMSIGTAGYTAMLCVLALEKEDITPESGEVVVTGASGGVGSIAVMLLSKLGYTVCAVTGKAAESEYLKALGAKSIIERSSLAESGKPLQKERWAAGIDVVGGKVLANLLASVKYGGAVACCGLAGGMSLPTTVAPFILRSVTLKGVDSVMCPTSQRQKAWSRLAQDLDFSKLDSLTKKIDFEETIEMSQAMIDGKTKGRMIVAINPGLDA